MAKISTRYQNRLLISFSEFLNKTKDIKYLNDFLTMDLNSNKAEYPTYPIKIINLKLDSYKMHNNISNTNDIDIKKYLNYFLTDIEIYSKDMNFDDEIFEGFYNSFIIPIQSIILNNILDITDNNIEKIFEVINLYENKSFGENLNQQSNVYIKKITHTLQTFIDNPENISKDFISKSVDEQKNIILKTIDLVKARIQNTSQPKGLIEKFNLPITLDTEKIEELQYLIELLFTNPTRKAKFHNSTLYKVVKTSAISKMTYQSKEYISLDDMNNGLFRGFKYYLIIEAIKEKEKNNITFNDNLKNEIEVLGKYKHHQDADFLCTIHKFYEHKKYSHYLPIVYLSIYSTIGYDDMYALSKNLFKNTTRKESTIQKFKVLKNIIETFSLY